MNRTTTNRWIASIGNTPAKTLAPTEEIGLGALTVSGRKLWWILELL